MTDDELLEKFEEEQCPTFDIWTKLTLDGKYDLIDKLRHVELADSGFQSIVVPAKGFSENDEVHNLVLDWLHEHRINVVNVGNTVTRLELSLHGENHD